MEPASKPEQPYKVGDFIVCRFPYNENPNSPAPETHIGLCIDIVDADGRETAVVLLYTTSQPWPAGMQLPPAVIRVPLERAKEYGQEKSFLIDARKIAFLPISEEFFPAINGKNHGIKGESTHLAKAARKRLEDLTKTGNSIVVLGPLRPR